MEKLTITLKTITPLFLGGAEPDKSAELRAPSIKGALRFWYRAIDPEYKQWEDKIFGSIEHGQGSFGIRVTHLEDNKKWDESKGRESRYDLLNIPHPKCPTNISEKDKNTWILNGVRYLSYSFNLGDNRRKYIPANKEFEISFLVHSHLDETVKAKTKKVLLSSIWLLGHIGGLGSRSRRGFGTIALHDWKLNGQLIAELPIAHKETSIENWESKFRQGLKTILGNGWFSGTRISDHTVFNENTKFFPFSEGQKSFTKDRTTFEPWEMALFEAGKIMQEFRMRYEPDYSMVKGHLGKKNPSAPCNTKREYIQDSPERASFGLPLSFRFSSMEHKVNGKDKTPNTTFIGHPDERNASPIHIRIVKIEEVCYPLFIFFDSPLINVKEQSDKENRHVMEPPPKNILDDFWNDMMTKNKGKEVTW